MILIVRNGTPFDGKLCERRLSPTAKVHIPKDLMDSHQSKCMVSNGDYKVHSLCDNGSDSLTVMPRKASYAHSPILK